MKRPVFLVIILSLCLAACAEDGGVHNVGLDKGYGKDATSHDQVGDSSGGNTGSKQDEIDPGVAGKPGVPGTSDRPGVQDEDTSHIDNPVQDVQNPGKTCELSRCGDVDVCLYSDRNNCGSCGKVCMGENASCKGGVCVNECTGLVCGDQCVDRLTDPGHCGACNVQCRQQEICVEGECVPQCAGDWCGDVCVDKSSNPEHCGGCNVACGDNQVCRESACVCAEGFESCKGVCVDVNSDIDGCLDCGTGCPLGCPDGNCGPENDQEVVDYARKFLFHVTNKCTYDLRDVIPYFVDFSGRGADFNYGYDKNCASFVGSVLKATGHLPVDGSYNSVRHFKDLCTGGKTGYHELADPRQARAGDIWYSDSHAEIVVEVDLASQKLKLIGSNNYDKPSDEIQCLQNNFTSSKFSSDATDYQRVTEHYRLFSKGTVCSRFK